MLTLPKVMLASVQERYKTRERLLLADARNHKRQQTHHRREAQNSMERLRLLRENMARLGISVEVVGTKK